MTLGYDVASPGVGGANICFNNFTDSDGKVKALAYGQLAYGADAAIPTVVTLAAGLPVQPQTGATWAVTQSGAWSVSITGTPTVSVSGTVPISIADGSNTTFGAEADAAAATDTATASYMGLFKRLLQRVTTLLSVLPSALTGAGNLKAAIVESTATVTVSGTVTCNVGTTGGLALDTSVNGLLVAQGSTTAGESGPLVQGAVTTAGPTYTTAKTSPLSLTTAGALRVDGSGVTQPVSGTFWQATQPVSIAATVTVAGTVTANQGGTWNIGTLTSITNTVTVQDTANGATGSAVPAHALFVGGKDPSGNLQGALVDANTRVLVNTNGPATYSATISGLALAASATDVFTVTGSGTKTVKITKVVLSGIQTTATQEVVTLLKRSTANTSGTSTNPTAVPYDSNDAAATATINAYTANPTTGTLVGNIRSFEMQFPTTSATGVNPVQFAFGGDAKPITLRGTGQVFAVNLGGGTMAGGKMDITVEWMEDNS